MYSLKTAFRWILLSTIIVSGIPWIAVISYNYVVRMRGQDPRYGIVAIAQNAERQESLKSSFLSELLQLSIDRGANLYSFDLVEAKNRLLNFPCIKAATVKRIPPGIVAIDYVLRKPVAFLSDFCKTAIYI